MERFRVKDKVKGLRLKGIERFRVKDKGKGLKLKGIERFRVKDKGKGLEYRVKKALTISSGKTEYPEVHFTSHLTIG